MRRALRIRALTAIFAAASLLTLIILGGPPTVVPPANAATILKCTAEQIPAWTGTMQAHVTYSGTGAYVPQIDVFFDHPIPNPPYTQAQIDVSIKNSAGTVVWTGTRLTRFSGTFYPKGPGGGTLYVKAGSRATARFRTWFSGGVYDRSCARTLA